MNCSKSSAFAILGVLALILCAGPAKAQTVLSEDFSTAFGTTPPAGWMTSGGTALWRFDNPGARLINAPLISPIAICDSDNAGPGSVTNSTMTSPPFNASTQVQLLLEWDHWMRSLAATTITTEVFDGTTWNVVQTVTGVDVATEANPIRESFDITALAGGSANAQIRYNYVAGFDWYWLIDNIEVYEPAQNDLALVSIDAPVINQQACINTSLTANEFVSVTTECVGSVQIPAGTVFVYELSVNGVLMATDAHVTTNLLNQGDTFPFTFTVPVNLSLPGSDDISVKVVWAGIDQDPANDSLTLNLHQPVQGIGYSESFDMLPGNNGVGNPTIFDVPPGWSNDPADGASINGNIIQDWAPQSVAAGNGPSADHTQGVGGFGNYMFIEDSSNTTGDISLVSPCFDTSTAPSNAAMSFWHHSTPQPGSSSDNVLFVDVINETTGGTVTMSVASFMGNGNSLWARKFVDLSAFMPDIVRVVFRANNDNASSADDVAIDDVTFFNQLPAIGQPPTPGLAVLDMNTSTNINSDPIIFGQPGPYFTSVTANDSLVIKMEGQSSQAVVMFTGPLNPRAASFGSIGFIDCGGPLQGNGLPSGLSLIGDGTQSGLFNSLFVISPSGQTELGLTAPSVPPMTLGAFQCAIFNTGGTGLMFSNCVELSIM